MLRHQSVYGNLLKAFLEKNPLTSVWLINTGWYGGKVPHAKRYDLSTTRSIIRSIQKNNHENIEFSKDKIFGFLVPVAMKDVDSRFLNPKSLWIDKVNYDQEALTLKRLMDENYSSKEIV